MRLLIGNLLHRVLDYLPAYPAKPIHRHRVYRDWEDCEPELRHLETLLPSADHRRRAIDAGANHGYYAVGLCRFFKQVDAFELIPELAEELRRAPLPNLRVWTEGVSDRPGSAVLYVPVRADGYRLLGWASLQPGNHPTAPRQEEISVTLGTLDAHGFDDVDFIKIDVEGHELAALNGARATITRCRPVVLIEVRPSNLAEVRRFFGTLDYTEKTIADFVSDEFPPTENLVFTPNNRGAVGTT